MNEFFRRLRYLLNRRRFDQELANDMEFHREMAAREGNRQFGNTLRLREEARDAWGWTWIDRFFQDLRYAARMLRKSPGFTLAAVLMLAIGIGINVAAFSFFNVFVFKPLPVRNPDTILRFQRLGPQSFSSDLPYPEMAFFREHSKTLLAILAVNDATLAVEGEQTQSSAGFVTANFFTELGSPATLGRTLDPRDEAPDAESVVVLGYGFWQRHFGADPFVIGKTIELNGKPATVIGVASNKFGGLRSRGKDLWLPITQQPRFVNGSKLLTDFSAGGDGVQMWGRLQPGLTSKVAEDELRSLAAELRKQHPADIWENEILFSKPGAYATAPHGHSRGTSNNDRNEVYPVMALVSALALLILAVACGNLGSLLLARGVARQREIAIRVSVGAGGGRLIRQLFTESLLLALLGSVAGLALGYIVLRSMMSLTEAPAWIDTTPDWRVIIFAIGIGFVAAVLFGLTPALQIARQRHRATITRQFLIGAQVAGSCILLIVAGLLVRALHHAMSAYPGFEYQQVVSISPGLATHAYSPDKARTYIDELRNRLHGVPGIKSVALASIPPLGNTVSTTGIEIAGRHVNIHTNHVDPQFFETMSIPLLRGRTLRPGETHAIIIGESLARLQWPGKDAVGKKFPPDGDSTGASVNHTVVGVVGSARLVQRQNAEAVEAYYPAEAADLPSMVILVKTSGPPEGLVPFVASIARSIDPNIFPEVQMLKSSFRRKLENTQNSALAVSLLGFVALLLASFGIVGLVAYAVSQRTKEIGIRMALGAKPSHILLVVLRQFSRPVVLGLLAGVGGATALSQLLRRELYGISNLDPITYLAAIGIFVITVIFAALLPARRALRVDPIRALRYE